MTGPARPIKATAWTTIAGLLIAALLAIGQAHAADFVPECAADAQRLCPHDVTGSARQAACVKQHRMSLTPACKQGLAAQARTAAAACRSDIERFCATVPASGGRLAKCMQPHRNELSPRCKAAAANL